MSDDSKEDASGSLVRELPARVVVIGDLNGHLSVLERALEGLGLIDRKGHWIGGRAVLVQLGDVPNRGPQPRAAMSLLLDLRPEARAAGGDVIWVLGNHEVLSALRHEAYVSVEEYLEHASPAELELFHLERFRVQFELLTPRPGADLVRPVGGRLRVWEEDHAPGKEAYRREMGPSGRLGAAIRELPVAVRLGPLVFVHGGLSRSWASFGLDGLEELRRAAWAAAPRFYEELSVESLFRDPAGPLWHRGYCLSPPTPELRAELDDALAAVGARHMVVGHTRADALQDGLPGRPAMRHGHRLVMADVGLGDPGEPGSVVVIQGKRVEAWSPGGARSALFTLADSGRAKGPRRRARRGGARAGVDRH